MVKNNNNRKLTKLRDGVCELFAVDGSDLDRNVVGVGHFHPVVDDPVPVRRLAHRCPHPVALNGYLIGWDSVATFIKPWL